MPATPEEVDAFLAHHGVLGMHWGVRKASSDEEEEKSSGSAKPSSGSKAPEVKTSPEAKAASEAFTPTTVKGLAAGVEKLTAKDKAVLKAAGMSPMQAEAMKAKYGPDSTKEDSGKKGLSPAQKKLIVYGAIGLGAAGLIAYGIHADKQDTLNSLISGGYEKEAAKAFLKSKPEEAKGIGGLIKSGVKRQSAEYLMESDISKASHSLGLTPEKLAKFSGEDLNFEPGHVFKRVSMDYEKEIRPDGFFAAHSDEDAERYKAVLPVYWKMWNPLNPATSGFVNHYAASVPIKVANEKNIYDMMKNSLGDVIQTSHGPESLRLYLKKSTANLLGSDDELMSKGYYNVIAGFADREDPVTKMLAEKFKAAGYHGIIDSNDAGSLSAQPIKFLDGTIFKIVGHEDLSASGIAAAQEAIHALVHIFQTFVRGMNEMIDNDVDEFLAHFGVKGMHWGVHHAKSDAHEYVKAKLAYGEGAGNRRKLIKAKVNARANKSPEYKKAFEEHVAKYSEHSDRLARQARVNKNVKATRKSVGKTARGVHRSLTGGFGSVSLASAGIAGAAVYAHQTGLDKRIFEALKNQTKKTDYADVAAWLKSQGVG
jgi:hypothetical protein